VYGGLFFAEVVPRAHCALIVLATYEMACGRLMVTNKWFVLLTRGTEVPT
jgi:hypothetical protein